MPVRVDVSCDVSLSMRRRGFFFDSSCFGRPFLAAALPRRPSLAAPPSPPLPHCSPSLQQEAAMGYWELGTDEMEYEYWHWGWHEHEWQANERTWDRHGGGGCGGWGSWGSGSYGSDSWGKGGKGG